LSLSVCLLCYAFVFPAELPDKTAFACLALAVRYRKFPVFSGAAAAFAVHVGLALTVGSLLTLLPHRLLEVIVALLFLACAWLLLRTPGEDAAREIGEAGTLAFIRVAATSFGLVLAAEFGDLTQILVVDLAAKYHDPFAVGLGSLLALWSVAAMVVAFGQVVTRFLPVRLITRLAALAMAALAVYAIASAIAG
jgi:putative Ca2+/H+ antiporter (TMEM165/GDT1 family)